MSKVLPSLNITIKNKVTLAKKSPYQWHMPQQRWPLIPPQITLDKPQITEKLTNAWHLLNIHYSDTFSEFQKAERMFNQHSYSPSEPPAPYCSPPHCWWKRHIRAWFENIQGLRAGGLLCVCVGGWTSHFFILNISKTKASAAFFSPTSHTHPHPSLTQKSHAEWAERGVKEGSNHCIQIHS